MSYGSEQIGAGRQASARKTKLIGLVSAFVILLTPGIAHAQVAQCAASENVGYIGVLGLQCNCTNGVATGGEWVFRTEPTVTGVTRGSPADGVLEAGDVIVAVDSYLITTAEGGRKFARATPGQPLRITVRRGEHLVEVTITPTAVCRTDARVAFTPQAGGGRGGRGVARLEAEVQAARAARTEIIKGDSARRFALNYARASQGRLDTARLQIAAAQLVEQRAAMEAMVRQRESFTRALTSLPPGSGWLGFGVNCRRCSWELSANDSLPKWTFREHPSVMLVEQGGPAERAGLRSGDTLTHIDGVSLLTEDGGRRFGAVRPGQTVRWTYRRDGTEGTVTLRAVERPRSPEALMHEQLIDELRAISRESNNATTQRRLEEVLTTLQRNLATIERGGITVVPRGGGRGGGGVPRSGGGGVGGARGEAGPRGAGEGGGGRGAMVVRQLRYSGAVGNAEVEVRGSGNIVTTIVQEGKEIIIETGTAQVRVRTN